MAFQLNGTENLMICLEVLQDLRDQLLGDPTRAIEAICRSGQLVPAPAFAGAGKSFEEREAAAEAKIAVVQKRKAQKEAIVSAISVIQESMRQISKAESLAERLTAGA